MYSEGQGVSRDAGKALENYRKAGELGDATAQCRLAEMYCLGRDAPQDAGEAVRWCRKALDQEKEPELDGNVAYTLGKSCYSGTGTPQDFALAAKLYSIAADQGNADAQYSLGLMHENGVSFSQDYGRARNVQEGRR